MNQQIQHGLVSGFLDSAQRWTDRSALEVDGQCLTYGDLRQRATKLAATIDAARGQTDVALTAVLAERSETAYVGILATLLSGHGYVPLQPTFPAERTGKMLQRAGCETLIVDRRGVDRLDDLLQAATQVRVIVLPEAEDVSALRVRWPRHTILGQRDLIDPKGWQPRAVDNEAIAYLLFTSGSTGEPKGVMVAHRNIHHFIQAMVQRYALSADDRFSQIFELVFDLSVFDMFVAWEVGACVCCPSKAQLLMPAQFVQDCDISVWFSVPSTALLMKKLGVLEPAVFPGIRLSLFCGEALTAEVASAWSQAAPNSVVENLYGPTELTLACTFYRWDGWSEDQCENGIVPIGWPYPNMRTLIVDDQLQEVPPGQTGELLMAGPQLTLGYWRDAERTSVAFVVPPGHQRTYYRTGDRVRRPVGDGPITFVGRVDHQLQVHGYRVELGEIEAVLRESAKVDLAVAVGWPPTPGGADHIEAFLEAPPGSLDLDALRREMKRRLPPYMVPKAYHVREGLPLNANGKVDRKALCSMLQQQYASTR